ncbi:MAG: CPBP family intramembrane metalloprotease [Bacteroidia bacterium]|nr:CPBP family intramembrane metalloprotease [Bacteroidia bacterium]
MKLIPSHLARHKWTVGLISLINLFTLFRFYEKGDVLHGLGYFFFFHVGLLVIYVLTKNAKTREIEVRQPRKELVVGLVLTAIGVLTLFVHFYLRSSEIELGFLIRLPILIAMLLCTFPVGIALHLLRKRYKLSELGLRVKPVRILLLGLLVWALTGLFAYLFNPEGILWHRVMDEFGGVAGIILQGVIGAALAEEFLRFFLQTRLKNTVQSVPMSILIATIIWAFMHFPKDYFETDDVYGLITYCIQIIPLGFLWGYLTHRTKSILPSVFAHGLNLWGFQNG